MAICSLRSHIVSDLLVQVHAKIQSSSPNKQVRQYIMDQTKLVAAVVESPEDFIASRSRGLINTEVRDAREGRLGTCTSFRCEGGASAYVAAASRNDP